MSRFPARCFSLAAAARNAPEGVRQPRLFPRPRALLRCLRSPPPAEEQRLCWAPGCTERDRRSFSEEAAKEKQPRRSSGQEQQQSPPRSRLAQQQQQWWRQRRPNSNCLLRALLCPPCSSPVKVGQDRGTVQSLRIGLRWSSPPSFPLAERRGWGPGAIVVVSGRQSSKKVSRLFVTGFKSPGGAVVRMQYCELLLLNPSCQQFGNLSLTGSRLTQPFILPSSCSSSFCSKGG